MKSIYDDESVQYRLKYVLEIKDGDKLISEAARNAGVDWKTMKSWVVKFETEGVAGLRNKPRGRYCSVDDPTEKRVIELKIVNRSRSARKIRDILNDGDNVVLHRQPIWRILKKAGESRRVVRPLKVYRDFERPRPNSLWQLDFMDAIVVEGIGLVYLALIIDDYSRKIVGGRFITNRTAYQMLSLMGITFEKYGMPPQIYNDRGTQFKSHLGKGYTHYERVCRRLGIEVISLVFG